MKYSTALFAENKAILSGQCIAFWILDADIAWLLLCWGCVQVLCLSRSTGWWAVFDKVYGSKIAVFYPYGCSTAESE